VSVSFVRRVFSFPVAIACLLGVVAVFTVHNRLDDPDMWLHLKTGQIVWQTHHIPQTDTFSYTTHHQPTIPHEWLGETTIFAAYRLGGYSGLMIWLCLAASAILVGSYALCSVYSGNAKVSLAGGMLVCFFAIIGFAIRPQMLGYFLLILELIVLYLGRIRNARWFFVLPPLFVLWVNTHGSFSLGLALAFILLVSSFFTFDNDLLTSASWPPSTRHTLAVALAISLPALLLNPAGMRLVLYPFRAMGSMTAATSIVSEWQPVSFADPRALAMLGVLAAIVLLAVVRRRPLFLDEALFLAAATYLAGSHRRLLFVFGILAAPVLCRLLADAWDNYSPARDHPAANAALIALAVLVCRLSFPTLQELNAQVAAKSPVGAVQFIEQNHLNGPMLNDWASGGYLVWALPDHPDFIDGRGDPFDQTGVTQQFGDWATLRTDPRLLLDKYNIAFCLLARDAPMRSVLPLLPNWRLAYADDAFVVFVRTASSAK
jgi:hypothetical protein